MEKSSRIGRTETYLNRVLSERGFLHFLLIDPEKTGDLSQTMPAAIEAGTSAFMVGGSTAVMTESYTEVISEIKRSSSLPVVIFPSGPYSIARGADALWFMSLLNSEDPYYIIGAQVLGSATIKRLNMEAIPMAYLIVGEGCAAGFVGRARPIPYEHPEIAAGFAMAAEYMGMRFIYLEAGSGAEHSIPTDFVSVVRKSVSIPIIVGGGIKSGTDAEQLVGAGADAIVTGNVFENMTNTRDKLCELIDGCKRGLSLRLRKTHITA